MSGKKTTIDLHLKLPALANDPVHVFVHSVTDPAAAEKILTIIKQLGWHSWVPENATESPQIFGPQHLGKLLLEYQRSVNAGRLLLIDAGLAIEKHSLESLVAIMNQLSQNEDLPLVLTALSNADPELNPYAGLEATADDENLLEGLVALLGPGQAHLLNIWPQHLLFFNALAVQVLAQTDTVAANALPRLMENGGRLLVADTLFMRSHQHKLFEQSVLDAHEQRRPPAWGLLTQRLDSWLRSDLTEMPEFAACHKPVTLHISHSWGGGVARWVENFIASDPDGLSFQLRSEGPQSSTGAGQRLSLYLRNKIDCPVASWWLQPPIRSTASTNSQYKAILLEISRRYGLGRVIVSSLVGHSLDALLTGLPTVQVLHDFYPLWPLLGIHPGQYLENGSRVRLEQALQEQQLLPDFNDRDARAWQGLAEDWHAAILASRTRMVAPSQSVANLLRNLDPLWADMEIRIIPHGLPPMEFSEKVLPRKREDGKLRLVVPGRVQQGKGLDLLLKALPELTRYAHIYLVGAGKEGDVFFGQSGVDVILQYHKSDLPGILARIGPHIAALLSVVPETFSFTLSEMQELRIPVVATRVGSFEERIVDGESGWLIEPDAASLVKTVKRLAQDRPAIESVHEHLANLNHPDAIHMLGEYEKLCPPVAGGELFLTIAQPKFWQCDSLAFEQVLLKKDLRSLRCELADVTNWARQSQLDLEEEQEQRERWVNSLNSQLDEERENSERWVNSLNQQLDEERVNTERWVNSLNQQLDEERVNTERWVNSLNQQLDEERENTKHWVNSLNQQLDEERENTKHWVNSLNQQLDEERENTKHWVNSLNQQLEEEIDNRERWVNSLNQQLDERGVELQTARQAHEQAVAKYNQLRAEHEGVLASSSWRITRPMRVGRRILGNFVRARAWNPAKWPLLLSQLFRTLKTQGLKGTLQRAQVAPLESVTPETYEIEAVEDIGSTGVPTHFPECSQPLVSIIIPVFNKWVYTAACLRSLAEVSGQASFEVIVVDDQSSDETNTRLAGISGLTCIRNDSNLGFIGSCNRGAEVARGSFLVMLNNDTQVLDGWLDALLDTFEKFPDTGMAGARLIYPDGSLQEAGGIIFSDGSGWNYGRDDDADKPEYQYTREVDYCSGACIMLRSELFEELNGFDTHYSPAYYEDTDLAFRVRARGLKVRVQARATIIHHEGVTSGTDIASGTKRYQELNCEKFLERWKDELANYPAPLSGIGDVAGLRKARDHRLKGRILVIDAYTPEPDQDSGSLRLCYLLDCFINLGYGVTFFADNRGHSGSYTTRLQRAGVEVLYGPWLDSLPDFFKERGADFFCVMISRHYIAANYISLLERYCPDARFIFDTVDLHYLREQRLAELEDSISLKKVSAQTRRSELAAIKAADATLVVSSVEKTVLEKDAPDAKVHIISNVHEVIGSRRPWSERKDIFFVGGYQHPPNVDAAIWFVKDIWPLVVAQLPDLRFHLIGSKAPEQIQQLHGNGVHFHGFVKSLEPWLDDCRLAVAPLRYGAGVKGKVNISMSRGQPMVATPMAVEGMFVKSGEEILVAQSAEDFADAIVRLYQDEQLWNHISAAGLENVRQYFSVETARLSLKELLRSLV